MAPSDAAPPVPSIRPTSAPVHRIAKITYRPRPSVKDEEQESRELALERKDVRSTERERAELRTLVENDERFGQAMDSAKKTIEKVTGCPFRGELLAPLAELVWKTLCILWDVEASRFVPKARLRTIIERLREELKGEREALEDSRRSYFKELVGLRQRCRSIDPKFEGLIDEHVYEDEPVMYYEALDYLDENTREHVAEIVEEKLKLIMMKHGAGHTGAHKEPEADPKKVKELKDKLKFSQEEVESLKRQLEALRNEHESMQNHLASIAKKAQEQKTRVDEEKDKALQKAEEEKAALKAQMLENQKQAEQQQQEAQKSRRRATLLQEEMVQIQQANDANSAETQKKLSLLKHQSLEEEAAAEKLANQAMEAQRDAEILAKSEVLKKGRWDMLRNKAFDITKSKKENSWNTVMGLIATVNDHTKDYKKQVEEKEHECDVLKKEISHLLKELTDITGLDETEAKNLIRVSNRRIMAWMAGEELPPDAAQPEGWGRIRSSIMDLAGKARLSMLGLDLPQQENSRSTDDSREPRDHPDLHIKCNEEIARLKAEIEQLKGTIDRLMVELAAATGSKDMDALRAKLGDDRLDWVFKRPSGNVFKRLYDDAIVRDRRNNLLRQRFAELQQQSLIENTFGKHCVPDSVVALFDGTTSTAYEESIYAFGFTSNLESTGSMNNTLRRPQSNSPRSGTGTTDGGRERIPAANNARSTSSGKVPRPLSAVLPKPYLELDLRPDGVRPTDLYHLATWDPRANDGPAPPRRPSSATARRVAAEREHNNPKRRPSSAARKSVGGRGPALQGSKSLPGLLY